MKRYIILAAVMATIILSAVACNKIEDNKGNQTQSINPAQTTDEYSINTEGLQSSVDNNSSTQDILIQGKYVGQIDGNSIEVIVDNSPAAFRNEGRFLETIDSLKEGELIEMSYHENEYGQYIISSIRKAS